MKDLKLFSSVDEAVEFESATETIAAYAGMLLREIHSELDAAAPSNERIAALEEKRERVLQEGRDIRPHHPAAIWKARYVYGLILKGVRR